MIIEKSLQVLWSGSIVRLLTKYLVHVALKKKCFWHWGWKKKPSCVDEKKIMPGTSEILGVKEFLTNEKVKCFTGQCFSPVFIQQVDLAGTFFIVNITDLQDIEM